MNYLFQLLFYFFSHKARQQRARQTAIMLIKAKIKAGQRLTYDEQEFATRFGIH